MLQASPNTKEIIFNKLNLTITGKIKLKDANILFPCVWCAMVKMATGSQNFFSHLTPNDVETFQKYMCQYIEVNDSDLGKRSLTLSDIYDNLDSFSVLLAEFLEFNFGFFSRAQSLIMVMIGRSTRKEDM
jgi:hypothetical protein